MNQPERSLWNWIGYVAGMVVLLAIAGFCWFGYRASYEPPAGENTGIRTIYVVVGFLSLLGVLGLVLNLCGLLVNTNPKR